jgi:fused signal recognition particle receptor
VQAVRGGEGADPSAVTFDAAEAAAARKMDVLIVDTAGRLHTKDNLMRELEKISRVVGRKIPGAPHETLLVLDATTGQNALSQAKLFTEGVGVTGLVLAKLDGTAKGGVVLGIWNEVKIPVKFIGLGEGFDDLAPFNAREFVDAVFGTGGDTEEQSEA